jgi:radical SAM-linked protein
MVEAVQRWRIAFRRGVPALELGPPEIARAWEAGLIGAGIPVVMTAAATPRPRLVFAAPLPPGRRAEHDLADLVLAERWSLPRLRAALAAALPVGFEVVDLNDVWLGAPAVTAALSAMSHRATVTGASVGELSAAAAALLAAERLDRTRTKGSEQRPSYDLRPLILALDVGAGAASSGGSGAPSEARSVVRMILRTASDGPSGRPDELLLALGEAAGQPLELVDLVRGRLWTADEVPTLANQAEPTGVGRTQAAP